MKIAIQGHPIRGKEVIRILESLGGQNIHAYWGHSGDSIYYYINKYCKIVYDSIHVLSLHDYKLYTLEEFEKEFPFKIGDKVITTNGTIGIIDRINLKDSHPYVIKTDDGNFYWCETSILKPYKEMKEERNITLTLDKAKEWYKKGGELKEIALQAFSEKELNLLPRSWEEFCDNYMIDDSEAYFDNCCTVHSADITYRNSLYDKNICPSKESAEAHLAMIQLEQLRDCWRQGWESDWNDEKQTKYCIVYYKGKLNISILYETRHFLSFPTMKMAEEFLKCFRDLIEKAGDLI